jgi:hypothetical protein
MAFLLSPSSPNLISNRNEIGGVLLGYLLQNSLPQTVNLVFNHVIPQDLFQKRQAELDSRDTPLNPPLIEVTSTVVQPFFDLPNVGTAQALINQFQEKINQSDPNNTKPLNLKTQSFLAVERKEILSDGESLSPPPIEISQLPTKPLNNTNTSSQSLNSPNNSSPRFLRSPSMLKRFSKSPTDYVAFEGPPIQPSPNSLAQIKVRFLSSPSPKDLQSRQSPSSLIIANEPSKENVGEVAEDKGGGFVISQSGSCFAEILPTAISSPENTLPNLSSSAPNNLNTAPQSLYTNLPKPPPPLSTPPKATNTKNNCSCFDEALKFFADLIEKCCEPTKVPAKPVAQSRKPRMTL